MKESKVDNSEEHWSALEGLRESPVMKLATEMTGSGIWKLEKGKQEKRKKEEQLGKQEINRWKQKVHGKGSDNMKKGEEVDACTHASAGTAGEVKEDKKCKEKREGGCWWLLSWLFGVHPSRQCWQCKRGTCSHPQWLIHQLRQPK